MQHHPQDSRNSRRRTERQTRAAAVAARKRQHLYAQTATERLVDDPPPLPPPSPPPSPIRSDIDPYIPIGDNKKQRIATEGLYATTADTLLFLPLYGLRRSVPVEKVPTLLEITVLVVRQEAVKKWKNAQRNGLAREDIHGWTVGELYKTIQAYNLPDELDERIVSDRRFTDHDEASDAREDYFACCRCFAGRFNPFNQHLVKAIEFRFPSSRATPVHHAGDPPLSIVVETTETWSYTMSFCGKECIKKCKIEAASGRYKPAVYKDRPRYRGSSTSFSYIDLTNE